MAKIKRICSIPGCNNKHQSRGWCKVHYNRWHRNGDPLAGPPRPQIAAIRLSEKQRYLFDVVLPYDGNECLIWPYYRLRGYGTARVNGKFCQAHRFVCTELNGPPPTPAHQAAHSCGNRSCVNPKHLRWATRAENEADKVLHGTVARGAKNGRVKLSETDVAEILSLKGGVSKGRLAILYGVSRTHIGKIHSGKKWAWLE